MQGAVRLCQLLRKFHWCTATFCMRGSTWCKWLSHSDTGGLDGYNTSKRFVLLFKDNYRLKTTVYSEYNLRSVLSHYCPHQQTNLTVRSVERYCEYHNISPRFRNRAHLECIENRNIFHIPCFQHLTHHSYSGRPFFSFQHDSDRQCTERS